MLNTERDNQMAYEHDLSTRVTRVEAAVETLTTTMNDVSTSIKHIERSVAGMGKTDMKTLLTIAGSVAGVILTIWFILVAPINLQLAMLKEDAEKTDRIVASRATLPGDVLRIEGMCLKTSDQLAAMERREAAAVERARFVEDLVKDIGNQKGIKR